MSLDSMASIYGNNMKHKHNLIWIDLEMTGLDPEHDHIIELATIISDAHLNILAEGPVFAIYQTIFSLCSYHIRIRQNCSGNNCIIIY